MWARFNWVGSIVQPTANEINDPGYLAKMAKIQKKVEKENDLTIMVVHGQVTADMIIEALVDFNQGAFTSKLIWDYTNADLTEVQNDELHHISSVAVSYSHLRKEGQTAIVMPETLGFGLGRMYEIISENDENPINYNIFKDIKKARAWLNS